MVSLSKNYLVSIEFYQTAPILLDDRARLVHFRDLNEGVGHFLVFLFS